MAAVPRPPPSRPHVPGPAFGRACESGAPPATAPVLTLASIDAEVKAASALSSATRVHLAAADAARRAAPCPPRPSRGFESDQARSRMWDLQSAQAVIEAMPQSARVGALGGPLAASQLPEADRSGLLLAAVLSKSGSDGSALYEVIKAAAFVAGYEAARRLDEPEFRAFPMSQALAALLVRGEHERATEAGEGGGGEGGGKGGGACGGSYML